MRFQRLDLNLLVALNTLLAERSVSLAADKLCLSQSATSSALARLRDYFGDELLIPKGRIMILTARAEELIEPVRAVLEQIRTTIAVSPQFEPATAERLIRVMASDYLTQVLIAKALRELEADAPHIRFEIQTLADNPIEAIDRSQIDLLVTIDYAVSADHPSRILFEEDYVVVGDRSNPAMTKPMTPELYFQLGHVTARFGRSRVPSFEDWFMRRQRQQRRVEVIASSFLSLPSLVVGTNRIATLHRRHAEQVVGMLPLTMCELPFDMPKIREAVQWNIANNNDQALRWIVDRLVSVASRSVAPAKGADAAEAEGDAFRHRLEIEYRMNHPQS